MEISDKLDKYPNGLFSDKFKETINKTKALFINHEEYINKPMVKCAVLGNVTSGKSTLLNALLERDILYEGKSEGTSCVAIIQSSLNNEEYFETYSGKVCPNKPMSISEIKNINYDNQTYSKYAMDINNYLDIYLNISNQSILKDFLFIDFPGYNANNFNTISEYCKHVDILIFCFRAESGISDDDIDKIKTIKDKIGKLLINFLINRCDECDDIHRDEIIDKLSPHLTGENAIYFISGREEKKKEINDFERHEQFKKFKEGLQRQKSLASLTYRKIFMDLICSVTDLLDCLRFTNFRESQFTDIAFDELRQQIKELITNEKKKFYKKQSNKAMLEYSNQANNEISHILLKQFINDHNLKDGIILSKYFYKLFIQNDAIGQPTFEWYEWGDKSEAMKEHFIDYFTNLNSIKSDMQEHYSDQVSKCLKDMLKFRDELNEIIKTIRELVIS